MIKKYKDFINESVGPNKEGSISINLSEEESELFTTEPKLSELIHDKKVALLTPELWFDENDKETIDTLGNYFDVKIENSEESMNEEFINDENQEWSHTSLICPYCNHEQDEHPDNLLDNGLTGGVEDEGGTTEFGECECEECEKPFEFCKQVEVRYYTMKKK